MLDNSTNLNLPYLVEAQAQKHVTVNEALRILDALIQLSVISRFVANPPASPLEGDRYIIGNAATGIWSGKDLQLAVFVDAAWTYFEPNTGWSCWVADEAVSVVYDGILWNDVTTLEQVTRLGIGATADVTNRLLVQSNAALFTSVVTANGGTGDVRLVLNKESNVDTASFLFQTGFSGRAEIGLTGADDFSFKVSADGSAFKTGIIIDKDTGYVGFNGAEGVFPMTCALPLSTTLSIVHDTSPNRGVASTILHVGTPNDTETFAGIGMFGIGDGDDLSREGNLFRVDQVGNTATSGWVKPGSFLVSTVPDASLSGEGTVVFVSDESGGGTLAFSDGLNWLRLADRVIIS